MPNNAYKTIALDKETTELFEKLFENHKENNDLKRFSKIKFMNIIMKEYSKMVEPNGRK